MKRETRKQWAERVLRWRASGLTAKEFAAREQVNATTLRWWGSTLRREARPRFLEVSVAAPARGTGIELVVRDVVVRVGSDFDEALLRRELSVLEAR